MTTHEIRHTLVHSPEQIFDLVADVESYPEFLPGWAAARISKHDGDVYYTDQVVRFGVIYERFGSKTALRRPERIDVTSTDRPFRTFRLTWRFDRLPENGCHVTLAMDVELRSRPLQGLFNWTIPRTGRSLVSAFEARARRLYGRPGPAAPAASTKNPPATEL